MFTVVIWLRPLKFNSANEIKSTSVSLKVRQYYQIEGLHQLGKRMSNAALPSLEKAQKK